MTGQRNMPGESFVGAALRAFEIGIWSWRDSPARVRCCPVAARLFGVPVAAGWEGLPLDRLSAGIHPDDRERFGALAAQARRTDGSFVTEYRTITETGRERRVLDRSVVEVNAAGQTVSVCGLVIDMTDRSGTDEVERTLFGSSDMQGLPRLDQAVEHALALRGLIDVIPGERGRLAGAMLDRTLAMLGVELAAVLRSDGYRPETDHGPVH